MRYDAAPVDNPPEISKQLSVSSSRVLRSEYPLMLCHEPEERNSQYPLYFCILGMWHDLIVNNTHQPIRNADINCGFCNARRSKQIGLESDVCDRNLSISLCWQMTRSKLIVSYRCFRTTYWYHIQGSR